MVDVSERAVDARAMRERDTRERLIAKVAILTEHNVRLLKQLKAAGIVAVPEPKADEVRPAILAEAVTVQLMRLQAELRLAEEEIGERDRELEQLRADHARVRAAGVGESSQSLQARRRAEVAEPPAFGVEADDDRFMPTDEDPALLNQQTIPEVAAAPTEPEPAVSPEIVPAEATAAGQIRDDPPAPRRRGRPGKVVAAILERKTAEPEQLGDVVHRYLVQRDSSASAPFIANAIAAAGRPVTVDQVAEACQQLVAAGRARAASLGAIPIWRAL